MKFAFAFNLLTLLIASCFINLFANSSWADEPDDGVAKRASARSGFNYFRIADDSRSNKTSIQDKDNDSVAGNENVGDTDNDRDDYDRDDELARSTRPRPSEIWSRKAIQETRIDIRESHAVSPLDRSSELNYGSGDWTQFYASPKVFAWAAADIRYQPLYFEDVALERYGQTGSINVQPIRSAAHFFKSVVFLPNHVRHDLPDSCDYPLGFCRPGSNIPCTQQIHYLGRPNR